MADVTYFKAAGKSLDACKKIVELRRAGNANRKKLLASIGAHESIERGEKLQGFTFKEGVLIPAGLSFKKSRNCNFYAPNCRTKEGREWKNRIAAAEYNMPGAEEFTRELGHGPWFGFSDGFRIAYAAFEKIGDDVIISIPVFSEEEKDPFVPPDAKPMKASEYWAMKELAESGA